MRQMHITQTTTSAERATLGERGENVAADRAEAEALAPWAAEIVEVDGGWIAYESMTDADTARKQR